MVINIQMIVEHTELPRTLTVLGEIHFPILYTSDPVESGKRV